MKTFDYNYRDSFLFAFFCKICQSCWGLKSKSPNMHKKTTNWRILVVVVKWRHRAIVSPANSRRISGRRFSAGENASAVRRLTIVLLTQISPKRAIASCWWILVALSAYFFCCHQHVSQRLTGCQTFFLCFICLHIWRTRGMLSNLKYRYRRTLFTKQNVSLIIHNNGCD